MRFLTARLSTRRRSRFAGAVVVMMGLLVTGGAFSAVASLAPASAQAGAADQSTVSAGRKLFLVGCASCHGQNGEGVLASDGSQYGPPLVGVGASSVDFQVGTGRMPLAQPGAQAAQKKVTYSPEQISQLAAYVASLGPGPAIPRRSDYSPSSIPANQRTTSVARGGQFFLTNCTACHNFAGSGGALPQGVAAPSLKETTPKHIYEALETGPGQMPVFSNGVLKPSEKRDIIAYLKSFDETPSYGGWTMGLLGPVSEGLFAWIVGIGGAVAFAIWIASHSTRSRKRSTS